MTKDELKERLERIADVIRYHKISIEHHKDQAKEHANLLEQAYEHQKDLKKEYDGKGA